MTDAASLGSQAVPRMSLRWTRSGPVTETPQASRARSAILPMMSATTRTSYSSLIFELRVSVFDLAIDLGQQLLVVLSLDGVVGELLGGDLAPGQARYVHQREQLGETCSGGGAGA